jgi:hypothetical protein
MEFSTPKCLSCDNDALYHVHNYGTLDQLFCELHLSPVFDKDKLPLHITYYEPEYITVARVEEEKIKVSKKKKAVAELVEAVVEEPAEEPVEELTE